MSERSFEHAEKYLQEKLNEQPTDQACLSALAVLLLEAGQYAKANNITRKLTSLVITSETQEDQGHNREATYDDRIEGIAEDDISKDLALSRKLAEREGFYEQSVAVDGESDARTRESEKDSNHEKPGTRSQADQGLEQPPPLIEQTDSINRARFRPIHTALDQRKLDLDDMLPISRQADYRREARAGQSEPTFDQPESELEDLLPIDRQLDQDTDRYSTGVDVDKLAGEISEGVDDDYPWSEDSDQEEDLESDITQRAPTEFDQEYAEDAFSESPSPEELRAIPDAKTTRERAQEVALGLVSEYRLSAEYGPVLTRIFTEYWWGRCKTSMREQLELAVSAKVLDMAREVRELWAEHPEYHQNVFNHCRYYGYESLPWRLAIRLVDAYRQYPQFEEIVGFLEFWYGEWDTRYSLQRQFSSYYLLIKYIVERSESDGVDPSDISDLFRKVAD